MKNGYKKILIICLSLIILLEINVMSDIITKYSYILFLFAIFGILIFLIGFERDSYLYKKDVIIVIVISCLFYFLITYAMGLFIGFVKNGYKLTSIAIIKNISPFFIIVFLEELIRYNLVKKGSRNTSILFLATAILILMDITLAIKGYNLHIRYSVVEFLLTYFFPSVFKNLFLTYAVYKSGYKSGIVYRGLMEGPMYFMPLFPKLGMYVGSILKMIFPIFLLFVIYKMTEQDRVKYVDKNYKHTKVWIAVFMVLVLIIIGINCSWFKYYSLTIGSGSMGPYINKGDVIIVEKLKNEELSSLKTGDVLVFNRNNVILVHRIIDIKMIKTKYYFYTKGDANDDIDRWITEEKDIIGIAKSRIMLIGYPSVWLSEFIKNNKK